MRDCEYMKDETFNYPKENLSGGELQHDNFGIYGYDYILRCTDCESFENNCEILKNFVEKFAKESGYREVGEHFTCENIKEKNEK